MHIVKRTFLKNSTSFEFDFLKEINCIYESTMTTIDFPLSASPNNTAGGSNQGSAAREEANSSTTDKKQVQDDPTAKSEEDSTNKANNQQDKDYITHPDSNLTGELGNSDMGQTDLGASGSGAKDL